MKKLMYVMTMAPMLALSLNAANQSILWNDGAWDAGGAPKGKLLSDNPGWWGERVYTGVTYSYENQPDRPADVLKNDATQFGRRLIDGNPAYFKPVGISGKPLVAMFDFKRPCVFNEVTLLSSAKDEGRGILDVSDDGTNWTRVTGFRFAGPRTRIILQAQSKGRHLRVSIRSRGRITKLDEVLVWGDGEVSAQYPEDMKPLRVKGASAYTDRRNGGIEIWPISEPKIKHDRSKDLVVCVPEDPRTRREKSVELAMAGNETETRYFAVVNAGRTAKQVHLAVDGLGDDVTAELRIGGVMRVDGGRFRAIEGDTAIYAPYPFFAADAKPPANVTAKYFANSEKVIGFPSSVPLAPGEGVTLMVRFTSHNAKPGKRRGAVAAGKIRLPVSLTVGDLMLPELPLWVHLYSPMTKQFPFESRARVERDVEMFAALGASTCYEMPLPGTKQELLRKRTPYTIFTPRRWLDLKLLHALKAGKESLDNPANRQKVAECVLAAAKEAKECGLPMKDWCLFLPDEPGRKNAALYGEIARIAKATLPEVQIYMNPCFWERDPTVSDDPFRPSPDVIYEYLKPFYNEVIDISCPARGMVIEGSKLVDELLTAKRRVNALYIHPPVPVGRTLAWTAFRNGFNGYAYYCYYSPRGDSYDISGWKSLSKAYVPVVPLAEDVAITPVYEMMREAREDFKMLHLVKTLGRKDLMSKLMEASTGSGEFAGMVPVTLDCQGLRDMTMEALCSKTKRMKRFSVVDCGGVPRLAVNGNPLSGTAVMPSPNAPAGTSVDTLKEFAQQGVDLSSDVWMMNDRRHKPRVWWIDEGVYDFKMFDALVNGLLDASEDGLIFPRIKIDPPEAWIKRYPEEMFARRVRPASRTWRELYRRMLRDMVAHVEASPYADRIGGYHIGALHCGEWLLESGEYIKTLPKVDWDVRDPLPPQHVISERKRLVKEMSDSVVHAMVEATDYMRELTKGEKWIGAFLGYYSLSHESLAKALENGKFDFCAAPPHYHTIREIGGTGRSQSYVQGSYRLHGCVYFEETDFRTFLSDADRSFPYVTRRRPLDEALSLMRRSIGKCLAGGWEHWWFLLGGNRSYSHPQMLETVKRGVELGRETLDTAQWKPADIAVFTSYGEYATSAGAHVQNLRHDLKVNMHAELLPRCGVTFDSYVLEDIADPRLPDYKIYFFPNAITVKPELRNKIKDCVRRAGKTAIWAYASGYSDGNTNSVDLIHDLTGLKMAEYYPVPTGRYSRVFVAEHDVTVDATGWRSVYFPIPDNPDGLREAFRSVGAHVWLDSDDTFIAGRDFVMIHASSDGEKKIILPRMCDVSEVFGLSSCRKGVKEITEFLKKGETRVYRMSGGDV